MVQPKKRSVGLGKAMATSTLLRVVKRKPAKEPESVDAPPLSSTDDEEEYEKGRSVKKAPVVVESPSRRTSSRQKASNPLPIVDSSSDSDSDFLSRRADLPKTTFGTRKTNNATGKSGAGERYPAKGAMENQGYKRKRDSDELSLSSLADSDIDFPEAKKMRTTGSDAPFAAFNKREAAKNAKPQFTYGKKLGQAISRRDTGLSSRSSGLVKSSQKNPTTKPSKPVASSTKGPARDKVQKKEASPSSSTRRPTSRLRGSGREKGDKTGGAQDRKSKRKDEPQLSGSDDDKPPSRLSGQKRGIKKATLGADSANFDDDSELSWPMSEPEEEEVAPPPPPEPKCPFCGQIVDAELLAQYSKGVRMPVTVQVKFCREHKKRSAQQEWRYPTIDWSKLETRLAGLGGLLVGIMDGRRAAPFADRFAENVKAGRNRTLLKTTGGIPVPGYYGPRGASTIAGILTRQLGPALRQRAVANRTIAARGPAAYIEEVLMLEAAVRLIMEDMAVGEDEARAVMKNSASAGELINEETAQVVEEQQTQVAGVSGSDLSDLDHASDDDGGDDGDVVSDDDGDDDDE